jgi:hypothetical protein
MSKKQNFL